MCIRDRVSSELSGSVRESRTPAALSSRSSACSVLVRSVVLMSVLLLQPESVPRFLPQMPPAFLLPEIAPWLVQFMI